MLGRKVAVRYDVLCIALAIPQSLQVTRCTTRTYHSHLPLAPTRISHLRYPLYLIHTETQEDVKDKVAPIFISIDSNRDTVQQLATYKKGSSRLFLLRESVDGGRGVEESRERVLRVGGIGLCITTPTVFRGVLHRVSVLRRATLTLLFLSPSFSPSHVTGRPPQTFTLELIG